VFEKIWDVEERMKEIEEYTGTKIISYGEISFDQTMDLVSFFDGAENVPELAVWISAKVPTFRISKVHIKSIVDTIEMYRPIQGVSEVIEDYVRETIEAVHGLMGLPDRITEKEDMDAYREYPLILQEGSSYIQTVDDSLEPFRQREVFECLLKYSSSGEDGQEILKGITKALLDVAFLKSPARGSKYSMGKVASELYLLKERHPNFAEYLQSIGSSSESLREKAEKLVYRIARGDQP